MTITTEDLKEASWSPAEIETAASLYSVDIPADFPYLTDKAKEAEEAFRAYAKIHNEVVAEAIKQCLTGGKK